MKIVYFYLHIREVDSDFERMFESNQKSTSTRGIERNIYYLPIIYI